jgi:hypothetical protein
VIEETTAFNISTQNYGLWQSVPDNHSKLWAVAVGSWQPLETMGCGSRFLTATQNYGLWQSVPNSHSKLWAVAVGSIQISYKGKTIVVFVWSYNLCQIMLCLFFHEFHFVVFQFWKSSNPVDHGVGSNHAALRRKSKDWFARNQDNVSDWGDMSIRWLLFQWANTIKIQLPVSVMV